MAPSKKVVASLVTLLVLDNKEKQEKVKKKKKWCKNWLLHRHLYSHMNLLNELRVYKPADFKHYLLVRQRRTSLTQSKGFCLFRFEAQ
jgi:hypothetical protein